MTALAAELVETLRNIALDLREGYEAGSWAVPEAVGIHPAFSERGGPQSSLTRALVASEFVKAAGRRGLQLRQVLGGALEIGEISDDIYAVIRLRRADTSRGDRRVLANSGSTWGGISDDGFWRECPFVFGWVVTSDGSLDLFVAEVTGTSEGNPPHYEFGWTYEFERPGDATGDSFNPSDDLDLGEWEAPEVEALGDEA